MLSGKEARRTRLAAGLALVLLGVVVVLTIVSVNDDLRRLSVQIPLLLLAVAGGWYALTRTGMRRLAGTAVVVVALVGVIGYEFVQDPSTLAVALGRVALLALAVPPLRFSIRPGALLLLLPPDVADEPGASSAPRATLKDVGRVAAGRPVVR